jgi:very-short-patch-repair endonuclease
VPFVAEVSASAPRAGTRLVFLRKLDAPRLVEESERLGKFDLRAIDDLRERSRGRRGLTPLTAAIAAYRPAPMTRSSLERAFLNLVRKAGLAEPAMNTWAEGYEVDALWEREKVAIELDGGNFHATTAARIKDPVRDARLQLAGYRPLRVSDTWLELDPAGVNRPPRTARYLRNPS